MIEKVDKLTAQRIAEKEPAVKPLNILVWQYTGSDVEGNPLPAKQQFESSIIDSRLIDKIKITTEPTDIPFKNLIEKEKKAPDVIIIKEDSSIGNGFGLIADVVYDTKENNPDVEFIFFGSKKNFATQILAGVDWVVSGEEPENLNKVLQIIDRIKKERDSQDLTKDEGDFYDKQSFGKYLDNKAEITADTRQELAQLNQLLTQYAQENNLKKEDVKIFDMGCGNGRLTIPLAEDGYQVVGVDLSDYLLNQMQTKQRTNKIPNNKLRIIKGDLKKLVERQEINSEIMAEFEKAKKKDPNVNPFKFFDERRINKFLGDKKFDIAMMNWHVFSEFLKMKERQTVLHNLFYHLKNEGSVLTLDVPLRNDENLPIGGDSSEGIYVGEKEFGGKRYKGYIPTEDELKDILKFTGFEHIKFNHWQTEAGVQKLTVIAKRI